MQHGGWWVLHAAGLRGEVDAGDHHHDVADLLHADGLQHDTPHQRHPNHRLDALDSGYSKYKAGFMKTVPSVNTASMTIIYLSHRTSGSRGNRFHEIHSIINFNQKVCLRHNNKI